ncbi:hypothetical protein TorRG33x02_327340 [Trema orientale]|uniref:Uncharacterized protein n=1 Tax=Trema orientale TaxID=63057 RepID=A0A2P5BAY4_TREOI|nr:hypothetical protein TorRG33x02_327340 [Trema orientale]
MLMLWSAEGSNIALAKKYILIILSSKFEERSRMVLPLKSWIGDSDENCIVKVIFNGDSSENAGLNAKVITATLAEKHVHLKEIVGLAPGYTCGLDPSQAASIQGELLDSTPVRDAEF